MSYNKDDHIKNKIKSYYKKKYVNNEQFDNYKKLKKTDIMYHMMQNLNSRICREFKMKNIKRTLKYADYIGCSPEVLKDHIQNQLKDNMTFDNYGDWEIDHIIPVSSFNLNDINQSKKCFNYLNLQPLWSIDNKKKYNKII